MLGYGVLALISLAVIGLLVWRAYSFDLRVRNDVIASDQGQATPQDVTVTFKVNYGQNKVTDLGQQVVKPPFTVKGLYDQISLIGKIGIILEQKQLGYLVRSVDGIEANGGNFWLTYLNGELVPGDLNTTQIQSGDSVELRYNHL